MHPLVRIRNRRLTQGRSAVLLTPRRAGFRCKANRKLRTLESVRVINRAPLARRSFSQPEKTPAVVGHSPGKYATWFRINRMRVIELVTHSPFRVERDRD